MVTFPSVSGPGLTQLVPLDPTKLPPVLAGHTATGLFYDIATGASFTGQPTVCFT
jgi:hypothetical protein